MSCHARTTRPRIADTSPSGAAGLVDADYALWAHETTPGRMHLDLMVDGMHCAGCIKRVEGALQACDGVIGARVNMSTKRVSVDWHEGEAEPGALAQVVAGLGFGVRPFDAERGLDAGDRDRGRELLLALGVASFAAGNVMLLSVSVWSGADDATRALFHWLSALIAMPAVVFAGRPFFRSAFSALRSGTLNMDVPISLAVILACGMSLYETIQHGAEAYFDAAVMLLFFLLVGRYLDHMMRARANSAVAGLLSLTAKGAIVIDADGNHNYRPVGEIETGMIVTAAPGDRIAVDGTVTRGASDLDVSMLTGESAPLTVTPGDTVHEGTLNLTGDLAIRVTARPGATLLSDIIAMMEAAENTKAGYVRLADAAAKIYAPLVHGLAALAFAGWFWVTGDWHISLFTAVAVLIITCPCALGLAVPVVQVVAGGVLFRNGIMIKDGSALERLAAIDTVVFDKTGTLTLGRPRLVSPAVIDVGMLAISAGLAAESNHPLSRAIMTLAAERSVAPVPVQSVREHPGRGLEGMVEGTPVRLGNRAWCGLGPEDDGPGANPAQLELCLRIGSQRPAVLRFEDALRPDAADVVDTLKSYGCRVEMLSGDRLETVSHIAEQLGIEDFRAQWSPQAKAAHISALRAAGKKVLVVGDGLNDAPALAAGHASMAPSSASDTGRMAADFVFLGDALRPVLIAHDISRRARRLVLQNFSLAAAYNTIAIPLAVMGFATPLVAAIAMSSSSLLVTGNALRLRLGTLPDGTSAPSRNETEAATDDRDAA